MGADAPPVVVLKFHALQVDRGNPRNDLEVGLQLVDDRASEIEAGLRGLIGGTTHRNNLPWFPNRRWKARGATSPTTSSPQLTNLPTGASVPGDFLNRVRGRYTDLGRGGAGYLAHLALARAEGAAGAAPRRDWLTLASESWTSRRSRRVGQHRVRLDPRAPRAPAPVAQPTARNGAPAHPHAAAAAPTAAPVRARPTRPRADAAGASADGSAASGSRGRPLRAGRCGLFGAVERAQPPRPTHSPAPVVTATATARACVRPAGVQDIGFSGTKYPNIREHTEDAIRAGYPRVLTLHRDGAEKRRRRLLANVPTRAGDDRDEYPPAVGRGRWKADVRYVPSSENRSHGAVLGIKLRRFCDGTRFRYVFY